MLIGRNTSSSSVSMLSGSIVLNDLSIVCLMYCEPSAPRVSHKSIKCLHGYTEKKSTIRYVSTTINSYSLKLSVKRVPMMSRKRSRNS